MDSWHGPGSGPLWPRHMLPKQFPDVRILLFQYVTDVGGEYDTNVLLTRLCDFRHENMSTQLRPLIFVGYGLGGVTIQRV
jgi:hypothetical protein